MAVVGFLKCLQDLDNMVAARGGALEEVEVLRIMVACLEGLKAVHGCGLVHRDIKGSNIMAHNLPEGGILYKIIDFGIAMAADEDGGATVATAMKTGGVRGVGTAHYMSPEQYGGEDITATTDIYSLGVTMFYCLTGHLPFADGETRPNKILRAICGMNEAPSVHEIVRLI
jgi:serine/threonine protein kinase